MLVITDIYGWNLLLSKYSINKIISIFIQLYRYSEEHLNQIW